MSCRDLKLGTDVEIDLHADLDLDDHRTLPLFHPVLLVSWLESASLRGLSNLRPCRTAMSIEARTARRRRKTPVRRQDRTTTVQCVDSGWLRTKEGYDRTSDARWRHPDMIKREASMNDAIPDGFKGA
jgi:hypothetical protein